MITPCIRCGRAATVQRWPSLAPGPDEHHAAHADGSAASVVGAGGTCRAATCVCGRALCGLDHKPGEPPHHRDSTDAGCTCGGA